MMHRLIHSLTHTPSKHKHTQEAKHRMVTTPLVPGGRSGGGGADKRKAVRNDGLPGCTTTTESTARPGLTD